MRVSETDNTPRCTIVEIYKLCDTDDSAKDTALCSRFSRTVLIQITCHSNQLLQYTWMLKLWVPVFGMKNIIITIIDEAGQPTRLAKSVMADYLTMLVLSHSPQVIVRLNTIQDSET